jgi:hypothetical protein
MEKRLDATLSALKTVQPPLAKFYDSLSDEQKARFGGPVGSRHRQQLNGEFIAALLRDFRQGGPKAIERVRRTQPAAYLKILLC